MTITRLEPSQRVAERWLVWFDDGSLLRVSEAEMVRFALYVGMEVPEELLSALHEASVRSAVRAKALDCLSRRPMSRRELVGRLCREKASPIPPELAEETADWLEELGYLNDAEYAKAVARHYSVKGYGDRKLRDELYRRGVPREFWEEAVAEAQPPEEGIDAFLRRRFRGGTPDRNELKRAGDALARRGYRWEEIREGLNRYGAEIEED